MVKTEDDETMTASSQLALGQRAMAFKKYSVASEHFSYAVELLTEEFGELEPEVGDALILYGKALLRNAIASSAVLGNNKDPEEATTSNAVAGPSTVLPPTAQSIQFHFGGDEEDEEEEEEEGEKEEEEDEFETAFNILEMARATFSKVEGAEKKVAECFRLLGDAASECERFEEAAAEYTSSLEILTPILESHDRTFSELYMLIALALDNIPEAVARAVDYAEKSRAVLVLKLAYLDSLGAERSETDEKEILDIKDLMSAVDDKIEDLKIVDDEAVKSASEQQLEDLLKTSLVPGSAATSGIINNLNSLVRKKKPVVIATDENGLAKRGREEEEKGKEQKRSKLE